MSSPEESPQAATTEPFFRVQRCASCDRTQHYERPRCMQCGSADLSLSTPSGLGVIHSFTVVHRSAMARWSAPYVVALVRLEEGPVVMSHVVGAEEDDLACELSVKAEWMSFDDGTRLPVFRCDDRSGDGASETR